MPNPPPVDPVNQNSLNTGKGSTTLSGPGDAQAWSKGNGAGSNLDERGILSQTSYGGALAAPGSLYKWSGPSQGATQAAYNSIANHGAAQINTAAGNPYLNKLSSNQSSMAGSAGQIGSSAKGINNVVGGLNSANAGLTNEINGTTQSQAQLQLQQGEQANLSSQLAAARSATGPTGALSAQTAANAGSNANLQTNQQMGIQRASETAAEEAQLGQNLNTMNTAYGTQGNLYGTQAGVYGTIGGQNLQEATAQQGMAQNQAQLNQNQTQFNQGVLESGQSALTQNAVAQGNLGIAQGSNYETAQGIGAGTSTAGAALQSQEIGAGASAGGAFGAAGLTALTSPSDENLKTDIGSAGVTPAQAAAAAPTTATAAPPPPPPSTGGQVTNAVESGGIGLGEGAAKGAAVGSAGGPLGTVGGAVVGAVMGALSGIFGSREHHGQETPAQMAIGSDVYSKQDIAPAGAIGAPGVSYNPSTGQPLDTANTAMNNTLNPGTAAKGSSPFASLKGTNPLSGFSNLGSTGLEAGQQMLAKYAPAPQQVTSDERLKVPTKDEEMTEADRFMKACTDSMATYRYKDPSDEPTAAPTGGHYMGVMAQDMERVPMIGHQLVKDTPKGKVLEIPATLSATLAAIGRLNQRLQGVESKIGCL